MSVAVGPAGMADPHDHLQRAVVRIFNGGRTVVGTGFLVAPDLIVTCAHVVEEALREKNKPLNVEGGEEVTVALTEGPPNDDEFVTAEVDGRYFRGKYAEDVAFLRVKTQLADIVPLTLATSRGLEGRTLRGWGFPKVGPDGLWMTATVIGPLDNQRTGRRIQLSSQEISPGRSGGPLWDAHGRVVGMAVAIIDQEAGTTGRHDRTAFMIAAEVLTHVCSELTIDHVALPKHAGQDRDALPIPQFQSRSQARAWLEERLLENRVIHSEFGPDGDYQFDPESEMASVWRRKVAEHVIPRNRQILAALDNNAPLLTPHEKVTREMFRQHVDDQEAFHIRGITTIRKRFPLEVEGLFRD